ncbi:uncharacterized protein LOC126667079 [Mercurialis annua]|uniref:uncharacterized protein LOC126667079 n=1 Tax=Mercurialis annua TaxID=3986 RepID=UPI002160D1CB|nr:uncharacterized protein LOC126667079 [Mercurialis annua]
MCSPRTETEVRGFLGMLQYISMFIAKLTSVCAPIFKLLKKSQSMIWSEQCQEAFDRIKEYLSNPPILKPPKSGKPLTLYLSIEEQSMGAMLAQEDVGYVEHAVYYLSKKLSENEQKYTMIEKMCLAMVWLTKKLRHYFMTYQIDVVSKIDPMRYLYKTPSLIGKLGRWLLLLSEFDIQYISKKVIKGRVVAEFLAQNPVNDDEPIDFSFPDEEIGLIDIGKWKMYFDGAMNKSGAGIGVILISPEGEWMPLSKRLDFWVTNTMSEYEACIFGLESLRAIGVKHVDIFGDSSLVIKQVRKEWEIKEEKLKPYLQYIEVLKTHFDVAEFRFIPREENQIADALAGLVLVWEDPGRLFIRPLVMVRSKVPCFKGTKVLDITRDEKPWYYDIQRFMQDKEYPKAATKKNKNLIRKLAQQFFLLQGKIYKRHHDLHLLCVDEEEAKQLMEEVYSGICGPHMNGKELSRKIMRQGYFWLTMEADCIHFVRRCHNCQIHGDLSHIPPSELHSLTSPWPFSAWGIDIIGKIHPTASNGHEFIVVAIDYFTRWVEAKSYKILGAKQMAEFIETRLIYRYGVPHHIVSDNGVQFQGEVRHLLHENGIEHHKSSPYRPQANGAVEAANKNVKKILAKMVETYRDWSKKLPYALHGYRTTARTSTGATPYTLVFGMEAVLPVEVELQSLRVVLEAQIPEYEWARARYEHLTILDEKRMRAMFNNQMYQRRVVRAFNKKVKINKIKEGDLVLKQSRPIPFDPRGKFRPNWEGPYLVKKIMSKGAVKLSDMEGNEFTEPINLDRLKKYYV